MNIKPKLKVVHKVEDLINFIEKNEPDKVEKIIEACPDIIKKTKMDDYEPIYYAVRYANIKVFKIILKNSSNYKYDENKLFNYIITYGNYKIFKHYIDFFNTNLNQLEKTLIQNVFKYEPHFNHNIVQSLLNETNFCYSIKISSDFYKMMKYNFIEDEMVNEEINIVFNKNDKGNCVELEQFLNERIDRFTIGFFRYNKLYLVKTKAIKKPRLLDEDFEKIVQYL